MEGGSALWNVNAAGVGLRYVLVDYSLHQQQVIMQTDQSNNPFELEAKSQLLTWTFPLHDFMFESIKWTCSWILDSWTFGQRSIQLCLMPNIITQHCSFLVFGLVTSCVAPQQQRAAHRTEHGGASQQSKSEALHRAVCAAQAEATRTVTKLN